MKQIENIFGISFELFSLIATTILIPVLAFLFVNFYTRLKEKLQIRSKLKNTKSYILFWINCIINNVDRKIKYLEDFKTDFTGMNKFEYIPFNRLNLHLDKLKIITAVETFSTLVNNLAGEKKSIEKHYYEFLNSIDFLETKTSEIRARVEEHGKKTANHFKLMRESFEFINEERIKYIQSDFNNVKKDKFLYPFYLIHEQNKDAFSIGLIEGKEQYMKPLDDLCTKSLLEDPSDTRIPIIQKQTQLFLNLHYYFEEEKKRLSEYITLCITQLDYSKINLYGFMNFHLSSKFKSIFKLN